MLAIGGVGGLAVGLAGREILENLFTGLIILSSSPFEVGEEISFSSTSSRVRPCWLPLHWLRLCTLYASELSAWQRLLLRVMSHHPLWGPVCSCSWWWCSCEDLDGR